jgi:hypothetical protein
VSARSRLERFARLPDLAPDLSALPTAQQELWPRLADIPEPFVLYGGTALALRLGHRQSVDFDFFAADDFAAGDLLDELRWLGRLEVVRMADNSLVVIEPGGVQLSFYGGMDLQAVAEPSVDRATGLVVASVFDLAGTKAKAILDRSEWRDYVDIATLLRAGHRLADVIGYAAAIFDRSFVFPAAVFLTSLVWFGDGTAGDVPADIRRELEIAVHDLDLADIPLVQPYRPTITP